jgi:hypothetical protein
MRQDNLERKKRPGAIVGPMQAAPDFITRITDPIKRTFAMKTAHAILPLLLALFAAPALAQAAGGTSGKGNSGDMSYQEYLIQRAKILLRMKGASPQPAQPPAQQPAKGDGAHDTTYGQGFASRKGARDGAGTKPAFERSRPERPERPQIEHPGRP